MFLKDRQALGPMGDLWREAMQDRVGGYSLRTIDDEAERAFWHSFMSRKEEYRPDAYSVPILAAAEEILGNEPYDSILELGPGWGNYTFGLAKHCHTMRCVDISGDVLDYIRRMGASQEISVQTELSKWETFDGEPADVVFAYNCFYRMQDIEACLTKLNAMGRKKHIIGMTGGPEKSYYTAIEDELGLVVGRRHLDYIYLQNILYQLGIDCSVRIVPGIRDYVYPDFEAACADAFRVILTEGYDPEPVRRLLQRFVVQELDGKWYYHHAFRGALLYW